MKKTADNADAGVSRLRSSSHNLSRYVLPTRACRSRPSLSSLRSDLPRQSFGLASQRLAQPLSRLRRLSGLAQRLVASLHRLSQPLWSCQHYSLNQKATPKRLRQQLTTNGSESDALLRRRRVCVVCVLSSLACDFEGLAILHSFFHVGFM